MRSDELELAQWMNACAAKDKRIERLLEDNQKLAAKLEKLPKMEELLRAYRKHTGGLGKFGTMAQTVGELLGEKGD